MNKVILIGNVGADPEIRETKAGKLVASFSIATNKKIRGEQQTEWHRITCWEKKAEVVENYVRKGDRIAIEGEIRCGTYTDKDGIERNTTDITAYQIELLSSTPTADNQRPTRQDRGGGYSNDPRPNPGRGRRGGGFNPRPQNDNDNRGFPGEIPF